MNFKIAAAGLGLAIVIGMLLTITGHCVRT